MYALIENDQIIKTTENLRKEFPNTSFPSLLPDEFRGWVKVLEEPVLPSSSHSVDTQEVVLSDGIPVISYTYRFYTQTELEQALKQYRDVYIEQEVSYDNGDYTFTVINTEENRNWLAGLELRWKADNTFSTIKFKQSDGSIVDAGLSDIQGLEKAMFAREQTGRNAEATILATHAITPYTDDTWKTDFDTEVAS